MEPQSYRANAPGSMMLFGEYAVLYGFNSLVSAINRRVYVEITPNKTAEINIKADLYGLYTVKLSNIQQAPPYNFITAVLTFYKQHFTYGFDVNVASQIDSNLGLGSSAAITIATLKAITNMLCLPLTNTELLKIAKKIMLSVQGVGSGADLAASIFGGVITFSSDPLEVKPLITKPIINVLYAGYKRKTPDVIKHIMSTIDKKLLQEIFVNINNCVTNAYYALQNSDWQLLGNIAKQQQKYMIQLGVSDAIIESLIVLLEKQPGMYGAKISGSGLGDCVIGFSAKTINAAYNLVLPAQSLHLEVETKGVV